MHVYIYICIYIYIYIGMYINMCCSHILTFQTDVVLSSYVSGVKGL